MSCLLCTPSWPTGNGVLFKRHYWQPVNFAIIFVRCNIFHFSCISLIPSKVLFSLQSHHMTVSSFLFKKWLYSHVCWRISRQDYRTHAIVGMTVLSQERSNIAEQAEKSWKKSIKLKILRGSNGNIKRGISWQYLLSM